MKAAVVRFPGSNCDRDCYRVLKDVAGMDTRFLWHKDHDIKGLDLIVLPGGFSYGDYLRCGAIARFSPVMEQVAEFAEKGGLVLGICNGFQILCEAGLLPGVLVRNKNLSFLCKHVNLRIDNATTVFTKDYTQGQVVNIPIAHGEGNYVADSATIKSLQDNNQIVFRYCDAEGSVSVESNPNGTMENIAGIINKKGNVLGMMPHPERAADSMMLSQDGAAMFTGLLKAVMS